MKETGNKAYRESGRTTPKSLTAIRWRRGLDYWRLLLSASFGSCFFVCVFVGNRHASFLKNVY